MSIFLRKVFGFTALLIAACAISGGGWAQQEAGEPATERAAAAPLWPSRFYLGDDAFTVYPPQLESWERDRLEGRAAVAVQAAGAEAPVFGVVSLSARTDVDATSGMVTVQDIAAVSGSFPTAGERAGAYLDAVRAHLATLTWQVTRAGLQAGLAIDQVAGRGQSQPLRNDPPRIVYVQSPTILVPIDGEPVLREVAGSSLRRVVNTRALILQDQVANRYFLYVAGYWLEAPALEGRWAEAQVRPMALNEAKQKALAEGSVDLLEDDGAESSRVPKVIVSTGPTELVQTDGPPQYAPIGRTDLLFVTNSPNRLFLDLHTQTHYVLLAGRWYRTSSLARGPWDYVAGADLPADFAMIPDDHPTASIRAAVPGTAEAQESVIANSVPQIATVKRSAARLEISYDGAPEFRPIEGTALEAAANAPVPVIRVDGRTYYALDNGVWFFSASAEGPWIAATSVPAVIYTIPRSHPLHYVTYVRVYDAMGDDVYVGYTPGYVGSYVTTESTVVYGTGWYYRPWIGTVWYAPPVTWGFGFSFYYSWWNPWPARVWWPAWRPVPCFRPAWGPWPYRHAGVKTFGVAVVGAGGPPNHGHGAIVADGGIHGRSAFRQHPVTAGGIYRRWDPHSVSSHRFGVQPDVRGSVRATDRGATFQPPMSRQRDERGPPLDRNQRFGESQRPPLDRSQRFGESQRPPLDRSQRFGESQRPPLDRDQRFGENQRPPLDRNQRFGENQRPPLDAPHWVRPEDHRDRNNLRDRAAAPQDAGPPRSAIRPPGAIPARPPTSADMPRSPGLWRGDRNAPESRPRQLDGGGRFGSHQDARTWAHRNDVAPPAAQDSRSSMPQSARPEPPGAAMEGRSSGPDATREFRAPSRRQDAQRDWTPASPPARVGPGATGPAAGMRPTPGGAPRGPRNGPAFAPR